MNGEEKRPGLRRAGDRDRDWAVNAAAVTTVTARVNVDSDGRRSSSTQWSSSSSPS